ncbi:hypothetical protein SmJEL517_g02282 [Synchytrium microbalum]|uniref:Rho-GAP domain-containing protein n=1 Tax=Synchytrium microbalum TaxID=1806994 RepID=A0A507CBJ5_9FUNG|nr:uncharacterized protein SmJEL517_g02282 [Synchytrium microbalum]TPX35324.1 hypothetical protein SmJEL517_g02282 [Synchytrium microbalum]
MATKQAPSFMEASQFARTEFTVQSYDQNIKHRYVDSLDELATMCLKVNQEIVQELHLLVQNLNICAEATKDSDLDGLLSSLQALLEAIGPNPVTSIHHLASSLPIQQTELYVSSLTAYNQRISSLLETIPHLMTNMKNVAKNMYLPLKHLVMVHYYMTRWCRISGDTTLDTFLMQLSDVVIGCYEVAGIEMEDHEIISLEDLLQTTTCLVPTIKDTVKSIITCLTAPADFEDCPIPRPPKYKGSLDCAMLQNGKFSVKASLVVLEESLLVLEKQKSRLLYVPYKTHDIQVMMIDLDDHGKMALQIRMGARVILFEVLSTDVVFLKTAFPHFLASASHGNKTPTSTDDPARGTSSRMNPFPVVHDGLASDSTSNFLQPNRFCGRLSDLPQTIAKTSTGIDLVVPLVLVRYLEYLIKHGCHSEGIFRLPGSIALVASIEAALCRMRWLSVYSSSTPVEDQPVVDILKLIRSEKASYEMAYEIADIVTSWIRYIQGSLIPETVSEEIQRLGNNVNVATVANVLTSLPLHRRRVFLYICDFFGQVVKCTELNGMTAKSLAKIFAPIFLNEKTGSNINIIVAEYIDIEKFIECCIENNLAITERLNVGKALEPSIGDQVANTADIIFRAYTLPIHRIRSLEDASLGKCLVSIVISNHIPYITLTLEATHASIFETRITPSLMVKVVHAVQVLLEFVSMDRTRQTYYLQLKTAELAQMFETVVKQKRLDCLNSMIDSFMSEQSIFISDEVGRQEMRQIESCVVDVIVSSRHHLGRANLVVSKAEDNKTFVSLVTTTNSLLLNTALDGSVSCVLDYSSRMLILRKSVSAHCIELTLIVANCMEEAAKVYEAIRGSLLATSRYDNQLSSNATTETIESKDADNSNDKASVMALFSNSSVESLPDLAKIVQKTTTVYRSSWAAQVLPVARNTAFATPALAVGGCSSQLDRFALANVLRQGNSPPAFKLSAATSIEAAVSSKPVEASDNFQGNNTVEVPQNVIWIPQPTIAAKRRFSGSPALPRGFGSQPAGFPKFANTMPSLNLHPTELETHFTISNNNTQNTDEGVATLPSSLADENHKTCDRCHNETDVESAPHIHRLVKDLVEHTPRVSTGRVLSVSEKAEESAPVLVEKNNVGDAENESVDEGAQDMYEDDEFIDDEEEDIRMYQQQAEASRKQRIELEDKMKKMRLEMQEMRDSIDFKTKDLFERGL